MSEHQNEDQDQGNAPGLATGPDQGKHRQHQGNGMEQEHSEERDHADHDGSTGEDQSTGLIWQRCHSPA